MKGFGMWKLTLKSYINISNYSSQVGNLSVLHMPWAASLMYFSSLDLAKHFSINPTYNELQSICLLFDQRIISETFVCLYSNSTFPYAICLAHAFIWFA